MSEEISRPEQMRHAVAGYVAAVHRAYAASAGARPPAPGGDRPLLGGEAFSVLAVAAGDLHLIATRQPLPAAAAGEVELEGEADGLRWRVRFYDAVLVPDLAAVGPGTGAGDDVRRVLGVRSWLYHLVASPSSGLTPHHARHAGTALAGGDVAAAARAGSPGSAR